MKIIKDTQIISALLPPSIATMVDPRVLSLYTCFNLVFPSNENLQRIYNNILSGYFKPFPNEIVEIIEKVTDSTLKLYKQIVEMLPRTPVKFHYIFNLRDLSRVYEGLSRADPENFGTKASVVKLWRNEAMRVFCDRLINEEDRTLVGEKLIPTIVKANFEDSYDYAM